jgi:hypothetical protein
MLLNVQNTPCLFPINHSSYRHFQMSALYTLYVSHCSCPSYCLPLRNLAASWCFVAVLGAELQQANISVWRGISLVYRPPQWNRGGDCGSVSVHSPHAISQTTLGRFWRDLGLAILTTIMRLAIEIPHLQNDTNWPKAGAMVMNSNVLVARFISIGPRGTLHLLWGMTCLLLPCF